MVYAFALLAILLVAAGYLLGSRRGQSREAALRSSLDERDQQLVLAEHELLRQRAVDPATGVHTSQFFHEFLEYEWRRASRERWAIAVILVELDHFRALNERRGPQAGEACLRAVAAVLKPLVHRPGDLIASYGSPGAFGVVLGRTDAGGAVMIAERFRAAVEALKTPNPASPTTPFLTATVGVAAVTPDRRTAWQDIELIAAADRALARAREAGRNTVVLEAPETTVR